MQTVMSAYETQIQEAEEKLRQCKLETENIMKHYDEIKANQEHYKQKIQQLND